MPPVLNQSLWKTPNIYNFVGYLYIDQPSTVFVCQPDGAFQIPYPAADIRYNNVTVGAYTDIRIGSTVWFGSAPRLYDYGRGRIRRTPTSNTLYIGRSSVGVADGESEFFPGSSYITVVDEFRPWSRIPYIADGLTAVTGNGTPALGTLFKDWDYDFTTYGVNAYPSINVGGGCAYAKYVDPNTGVITINFNVGVLSPFLDGAHSTWLWDLRDGTITSGSATNPIITATFPPGRRVISISATDTNGNTGIRYLLVVAADDVTLTPIKKFDVSSNAIEIQKGRNFDVRVLENIPRSIFPDQACVVYWEEEYYGSTQESLNVSSDITNAQTGFEHIKFAGWHYQDQNNESGQEKGLISEVTMKCLDTVGWLGVLPGFPFEMDRKGTPTSWLYQHAANMDRFFWFILQWHSTALMVTDYYSRNSLGLSAEDYAFARLGSSGGSLFEQIHKLAENAIGYLCGSNELGQLYIRPDPFLLLSGDRTSVSIVSLTEDDIVDIKFTGEHFPRSNWDRGAAIVATTVDVGNVSTIPTAFVVAPGLSPGQGIASNDKNEMLVKDSTELSNRIGNLHARSNSIYSYLEVTILEPGDAGLDPAYGQWVMLSLSSTYAAQRSISFTSARCLIRKVDTQISVSEKGSTKQTVLTLEVETSGISAAVDPQPQDNNTSVNQLNPLVPAQIIIPAPPSGPSAGGSNLPTKTGDFAFTGAGLHAWVVSNFTRTPLYRDITPTLGAGFQIKHGVLQVGGKGGWVLPSDGTNSKVIHAPDVFATPVVWTAGASQSGIYNVLRASSAAGKILIYSPGTGVTTTYDLTLSNGGFTVIPGTPGPDGIWVSNSGWQVTANTLNNPGFVQTLLDITKALGSPITNVSSVVMHYNLTKGYFVGLGFGNNLKIYNGGVQIGNAGIDSSLDPDGTNKTLTVTLSAATIDRIDCHLRASDRPVGTGVDGTAVITKIEIFTGQTAVAYSSNDGATFAAPVNIGTPPGPIGGFDLSRFSDTSYAAIYRAVYKATTLGGAYSLDQSFTANPILIEIPWGKWGSLSLNNTGSSPDYCVGLDAPDANGHTLYKISGGIQTNITPVISGNPGIPVSANCLTTYLGSYIALLASFGGTIHLVTSSNAGATWVDRGTLAAIYARVRRLAPNVGQIAFAGTALDYTANFGVALSPKTKPSSDDLVFFEFYS